MHDLKERRIAFFRRECFADLLLVADQRDLRFVFFFRHHGTANELQNVLIAAHYVQYNFHMSNPFRCERL